MNTDTQLPTFPVKDHGAFMNFALAQALRSPEAKNKFCVAAIIVDEETGQVLSTGYSLEYPRDYRDDEGTTMQSNAVS